MPISGVVISSKVTEKKEVLRCLATIPEVEVHGDDEKGNIVAVLETQSSEEMEKIIDRISKDQNVLHVGLTYLNTEDEAERMANGETLEKPFGFRKPLSDESNR
jgi:nitrate reductase NapD